MTVSRRYGGFKSTVGDATGNQLAILLTEDYRVLHIASEADAMTDWAVAAPTHPTVYIHSETTPATDYISFDHDATDGTINVASGNLKLAIDGTDEITLTSANFHPTTNNSNALGISGTAWADVFLASGAVINFDAGDVTITHSANSLAVAGGTSYTFDADVTPDANDSAQLGVSGTAWSDLFLASGGVVNFNAGDITITHSANALAFAGATAAGVNGYSFDTAAGAIASEAHGVDVTTTGTLASGKSLVGANVKVTAAGTAGAWLAGLFVNATQASKMVNGYLTAAEFELTSTAAGASDNSVIVLNSVRNHTGSPPACDPYITLREYGTTYANVLFRVFGDTGQGTTGAFSNTALITSAQNAYEAECNAAVRCMSGSTAFWLLASTTAPTS